MLIERISEKLMPMSSQSHSKHGYMIWMLKKLPYLSKIVWCILCEWLVFLYKAKGVFLLLCAIQKEHFLIAGYPYWFHHGFPLFRCHMKSFINWKENILKKEKFMLKFCKCIIWSMKREQLYGTKMGWNKAKGRTKRHGTSSIK